jgi:hypothetical protein
MTALDIMIALDPFIHVTVTAHLRVTDLLKKHSWETILSLHPEARRLVARIEAAGLT